MKNQFSQGFTLIELMITIVILAILTAIAVPSYSNYVRKAHIKAAQSDLIALSLAFENYYQRNLSYPTTTYNATADISTAFPTWHASENVFNFKTTVATATSYTLQAEGTGDLTGCIFNITEANIRTITNCPGVSSW